MVRKKDKGVGKRLAVLAALVAGLAVGIIMMGQRTPKLAGKAAAAGPEMPLGDFDAVSEGLSGELYFFKGYYVFKYVGGGFVSVVNTTTMPAMPGVDISDLHDVDAAVFVPKIGSTVLNSVVIYKGDHYWRWDIGRNVVATRGQISAIPVATGVSPAFPQTGGFDSVTLFSAQNKLVYYKGAYGWSYYLPTGTIVSGFPISTLRSSSVGDIFPAFPDGINIPQPKASVEVGGNIIFYGGPRYYVWNQTTTKFTSTNNFRNYIYETYARYPFVAILTPERGDPKIKNMATIKIEDKTAGSANSSYMIPHIQTGSNITVSARAENVPAGGGVLFGISGPRYSETIADNSVPYQVTFSKLSKAQYTLTAKVTDSAGKPLDGLYANAGDVVNGVAVGDVIAAVGDSIMAGLYGREISGYTIQSASEVPSAYGNLVSVYSRNFPQADPSTGKYLESFLTDLNNRYTNASGVPVFIANEGWSGDSTGRYVYHYISSASDYGWKQRMNLLKPNVWLINLGANDARLGASYDDFRKNMLTIISKMKQISPGSRIFVSSPSYFNYLEYPKAEAAYLPALREIINSDPNVYSGPDFYGFFAQAANRETYYAAEPNGVWAGKKVVHLNLSGEIKMAEMWMAAIVANNNSSAF